MVGVPFSVPLKPTKRGFPNKDEPPILETRLLRLQSRLWPLLPTFEQYDSTFPGSLWSIWGSGHGGTL